MVLIVELRQNTEMMEAQIHQSRTEAALSEQQANYNSDYMPAIEVKIAAGEELSPEEMNRYQDWFRAFNRNMDNQMWQHSKGFLGDNIPRSIRFAVNEIIGSSQLGIAEWDRQKVSYTDEYIALVEETIADLRDRRLVRESALGAPSDPEPPPSLPSPEVVRSGVETFVAALSQRDQDAVTGYWGAGDEDGLNELLDVMDRRDFAATLGQVREATLEGDAAIVMLDVTATYRSNFGQLREETLDFRARFERMDSRWQLMSCRLR